MSTTIDGTTGVTAPSGAIFNGIATSTVVTPTSGTSVDFTSIPSWVNRITVMINVLLSAGTSSYLIQLGTSGGIISTGYSSSGTGLAAAAFVTASSTSGFITRNARTASSALSGVCYITKLTGNTWVMNGAFATASTTENSIFSGGVALAAALTTVRFTTVNGTDTFTSGSINILYE